jgi:ParB family chromosome partitioning protein
MAKRPVRKPATRILEDVPRPSPSSIMEAFYGGTPEARGAQRELPIDRLDPNPTQPRRWFDGEQLAALTDSIRELGLIQALVVRPVGERYQIVCGERRYRACLALGMKMVRADIREVDEATAYKLALAENVQRNSLTPVEEAVAYQRLLDDGLSQAAVARGLGIDRRRVSEKLLLLELPEETQELLSARADTFTERHARLLAQAAGSVDVDLLARRCVDASWSTRRLEAEIARSQHRPSAPSPRLFENIRYVINKRGGFTLTVRARSRQEVARTIAELDEKLSELRSAFDGASARADKESTIHPED